MQGKPRVALAPRLSPLAAMDWLIVLDRGRVVEEGDHRSLLARDGLYARLWAHQSGGFLGDDLVEVAADAKEAIAQARSDVDATADETRARRLEPTLIGHDLPAGSEAPG